MKSRRRNYEGCISVILHLVLILCPSVVMGQMHRYNPNFAISHRNFCDTIPIEVEDDQLYINVTMNGKSYRFNLDTGSSQGMVFTGSRIDSLKELGNIISRDANNQTDTVRVVQIPKFTLGSLSIDGYVASLLPSSAVRQKFDAIIGFDLFNRGICGKIDTENKWLILSDQKRIFKKEEENGYGIKYKLKWFVPYLYVSPFTLHTDEVLFDTGFNQLYTMNKDGFDKFENDPSFNVLHSSVKHQIEGRAHGQMSIGVFGAEDKDEVVFLHLDQLKWGKLSFTNVKAITTQGASKIGAPLLQYGALIINPFKKKLTLLPYNNQCNDTINVDNKQFSVAFIPVGKQTKVGLIWEKSEPYLAGMRQGDIVLRIDNRIINSFSDFIRFRFVKGEEHRFYLRDKNGLEKTVVCKIKE